MQQGWPILDFQTLASGLVGLFLLGALFKRAFDGYIETKARIKHNTSAPLLNAVSLTWERDQQERLLQFMERIARSLEAVAKTQRIALRQTKQYQEQFNKTQSDILERLEDLLEEIKDVKPNRRK